jgi:uncharacterized membrane protein
MMVGGCQRRRRERWQTAWPLRGKRGVSRERKEVRGMAAIVVLLMAIVVLFAFGFTVLYFAMRLMDKLFWQKGSEGDE